VKKMEAIMSLRIIASGAALSAALILSGCGTTTGDRALSGGMLGAGAGALIGSAAGAAGTGAVIGAVGGAAIGASTSPCDLDLGAPFWREHGGRAGYEHRCGHAPPN
jgi:osmotically inducible lipoprotein OsmB